jgi:hypothetical protein
MEKFGVPCPQCGSVRVIVGDKAIVSLIVGSITPESKPHLSQLHRCSCQDCRHTFQHDFSFCE